MSINVPSTYNPYLVLGDLGKRNGINARDYGYTSTGGDTVTAEPSLIEAANFQFSRKGARFSGVTFQPNHWTTTSTSPTVISNTSSRRLDAFTLGSRCHRNTGDFSGTSYHRLRIQMFAKGAALQYFLFRVEGNSRTAILQKIISQPTTDYIWTTQEWNIPLSDTQTAGTEQYLVWSFGAEGASGGALVDGSGGADLAEIVQIQTASAIVNGSQMYDQIFAP